MPTTRASRGFTLIECMIAMMVMLVGATGMLAIYRTGVNMNGDARRMTRATAIAQDLLNNLDMQGYDESSGSPFANSSTSNDADVGDGAFKFETDANPLTSGLADHGEADITTLSTAGRWYGIPAAQLGQYQRFWNVAYLETGGDSAKDAVQVAVVVRWPHQGAWRRVVVFATKRNPNAE